MKEFLASGQVGNIELEAQRKLREQVEQRWDQIGFLDGLSGVIKENMATLYENQAKFLINEATNADNSGSFETVVFPLVRRIFSKLLANDIVSVQAMNLPVGRLFFFLPVTSERDWTDAMGNPFSGSTMENGMQGSHKGLMGYDRVNKNKEGVVEPRYYLPDECVNGLENQFEIIGSTGDTKYALSAYTEAIEAAKAEGLPAAAVRKVGPEVVRYFEKSLYDLFYDDFLFDQSKGKVTIRVVEQENVTPMKFAFGKLVALEAGEAMQLGGDDTVRNVIVEVSGFNQFGNGQLTGPDGNEMDTEEFLASLKLFSKAAVSGESGTTVFAAGESIPFRVVTQKYGKGIVEYNKGCDANGKIYLELDLTKPCKMQNRTLDAYIGVSEADAQTIISNLYAAWAQYDSLELETEIGEVSFKLDSVTVSVAERKLRATWSPELAQDVAAFHNIDAEAELTNLLSEQIAAEIDREILRDLRKAAPWQQRFDVNGWRRMAGFSTNYTQKDWNQELMTKINQIGAQIHKSTLRGGVHFVVVSSEISALLDNLEYFHVSDASAESDQYNMGIEKIGSLNARYTVYRDPYAPHWSMIIGHKGSSLLDTGYIYAPYVPMQLTPTMYNPMNFAPIKGILTRYAKKCVNNRYYGHVRVDGLVHWNTAEFR